MSEPFELEEIKIQEEKQSALEEVKVLQNSSSIEELPAKSVDSNDFKSANDGSPPREGPPTDDILQDSDKVRPRDKMDKHDRRSYPRG